MAGEPDWRDASAYDLSQLDRLAIAWEFLRRNPRYRDDYEKLMAELDLEARAALAERWGLSFCSGSGPQYGEGRNSMAAGGRRHQRGPGQCPR
ncbi:transcriptional regulator domain-containing protein [Enhydrobacter aerosaccus]|uniref:transcriptional regulator domain-containing protein n=1 Tax=Enhydrobacter aerosaccus TaxID=225324 RepID=UPI003AF3B73D